MATPNVNLSQPVAGKLPLEMVRALAAPLPMEALKAHPTKDYLSSVKAIFVIERLNQVFGIGGWTYQSSVIEAGAPTMVPDDKRPGQTKEKPGMIVMYVVLEVPEYGIRLEQYGGSDNADRGDAYKGATTDALTKIASYMGVAMDVYKGGGPTKQNPRGMAVVAPRKQHTPAQQAIVKAKLGQAAPAIADQIPEEYDSQEVTYDEVEMDPEERSFLERELAGSLELAERRKVAMQAFQVMKGRYVALSALKTYYAVLALHGAKHSTEFALSPEGQAAAQRCFADMRQDVVKRERAR